MIKLSVLENKKTEKHKLLFGVVPRAGIEPARLAALVLRPTRLPIPPSGLENGVQIYNNFIENFNFYPNFSCLKINFLSVECNVNVIGELLLFFSELSEMMTDVRQIKILRFQFFVQPQNIRQNEMCRMRIFFPNTIQYQVIQISQFLFFFFRNKTGVCNIDEILKFKSMNSQLVMHHFHRFYFSI